MGVDNRFVIGVNRNNRPGRNRALNIRSRQSSKLQSEFFFESFIKIKTDLITAQILRRIKLLVPDQRQRQAVYAGDTGYVHLFIIQNQIERFGLYFFVFDDIADNDITQNRINIYRHVFRFKIVPQLKGQFQVGDGAAFYRIGIEPHLARIFQRFMVNQL